MSKTKSLTITLPDDLADWVREKVSVGEYESESEVVAEGLRDLVAHDAVIERWLETEVIPTYDRIKSGQEKTYTVEEVRARLDARAAALAAELAAKRA